MAHQRKAIRAAAKTLLENASIVSAGRVFASRRQPIDDALLPCLNVSTGEETVVPEYTSDSVYRRELELTVSVTAKDDDEATLANTADDLARLVESAIEADHTLGGTAAVTNYAKSEYASDGSTGAFIGTLRLTFIVTYIY